MWACPVSLPSVVRTSTAWWTTEAGKFDLVITKEISRFARNTLDSIQYTRQLLNAGVGVFVQNDNINTIDEDSELRLSIMSSIAKDELRKLSSCVKFGHQQAIKSNVVLGNIDKIFATPEGNGTMRLDIKLFTGESCEKYLQTLKRRRNSEGRTGRTFKKIAAKAAIFYCIFTLQVALSSNISSSALYSCPLVPPGKRVLLLPHRQPIFRHCSSGMPWR